MKKFVIIALCCLLWGAAADTVRSQERSTMETADSFFHHVKTGEVEDIRAMLMDPLKSRLDRLLRDNHIAFDESVVLDPYSLLPTWLQPR